MLEGKPHPAQLTCLHGTNGTNQPTMCPTCSARLPPTLCPGCPPAACPIPVFYCARLPQATTHFESGLGVALKGKVPPGAVTLLRYVAPAALYRLVLAPG